MRGKHTTHPVVQKCITAASEGLRRFAVGRHQAKQSGVEIEHPSEYAGIIFSGNPHETVPRRLLLDDRLSPLERNLWQIFRLFMNADGVTAFPTYEKLRPYLGANPGKPASRETVAKALSVLRLTRWLSLARHVRDDATRQVLGNVYILHDEAIGCTEAMELDPEYMGLVGACLERPNKAVQEIAALTFEELKHSAGQAVPSRLEVISDRFQAQGLLSDYHESAAREPEFGIRTELSPSAEDLSSDSELGANAGQNADFDPSSESELSYSDAQNTLVRIPNSYSTYTNTNAFVSKKLVPHAGADQMDAIRWPSSFHTRLTPQQQQTALQSLQMVPHTLVETVLDQWHARCEQNSVRKPLGYLLTCIQKALAGEFNPWQPTAAPRGSQPGDSRPSVERPRLSTPPTANRQPPTVQLQPEPKPTVDVESSRSQLREVMAQLKRHGRQQ